MRILIAAILSLALATRAEASAFGVNLGDQPSKFAGKTGVHPNHFKLSVPQPNSEFDTYSAISTPQTGICKIWGVGRTHSNDRYGEGVQSAYKKLKSALISRYGAGQEFDALRAGAIWSDPDEWVMAIKQNERELAIFWTANNLPKELSGITLEVNSVNSSSAYLELTYEFKNFTNCKQVITAKENDGL